MATKTISGVYAAVLTPRRSDDSIDVATLKQLILFLLSKGISSFAMNGATGEFCLTTPHQLRALLTVVHETCEGKAHILCGVGAPGIALATELASIAQDEGATGLLLPMPYFFPYQQEDLDLFCRQVASSTYLPILLYNLPQFSTGLQNKTARTLINEVPNIVGIKDSSGSLEILRELTTGGEEACRIIGNDTALAPALIEGVCDGVISGVACALPELILEMYGQGGHPDSAEFLHSARLLEDFIAQLDVFPTPWALKWILEERGIIPATFSQPVTLHRTAQSKLMRSWFREWFPTAVPNKLISR